MMGDSIVQKLEVKKHNLQIMDRASACMKEKPELHKSHETSIFTVWFIVWCIVKKQDPVLIFCYN